MNTTLAEVARSIDNPSFLESADSAREMRVLLDPLYSPKQRLHEGIRDRSDWKVCARAFRAYATELVNLRDEKLQEADDAVNSDLPTAIEHTTDLLEEVATIDAEITHLESNGARHP